MDALLARLQEKHVQFIMADLQGEKLQQRIEAEVIGFYQWAANHSLNELVDVALVKAVVHRNVKRAPYTKRLHEIIVKTILAGVQADINQSTSISTLIPKSEFDDFVQHLAQYEEMRVDVIRAVLKSPLYSELISDVLYYGIKDYVMNENMVTKKVPGVSSIMKMGAKSINKAMPNLEQMAEGAVKKYIESNINRTLDLSERILNNSLNEQNIQKVADHFWQAVESKEFSVAADYVSEKEIDDGVEMAKKLWLQVREADYIHNLIDVVLDQFFAEYASQPLADLLNNLGYEQAYVVDELRAHLPDLLERGAVRGFMEERIRANLNRFYEQADLIVIE